MNSWGKFLRWGDLFSEINIFLRVSFAYHILALVHAHRVKITGTITQIYRFKGSEHTSLLLDA